MRRGTMLGGAIFVISVVTVTGSCLAPLGMENGDIKDNQITVSSSFEPNSVGSERGRLNAEHGGGAWCPKSFISQESREYLEIDLGEEHSVTGVITQGRFANGLGQEFAEYYTLEYWNPGMEEYIKYTGDNGESILLGNTDTFTESRVLLKPSILATKVRIVPYSKHMRTVCMRIELLGCSPTPNPLPLENSDRTKFLGILIGGLLTLSVLPYPAVYWRNITEMNLNLFTRNLEYIHLQPYSPSILLLSLLYTLHPRVFIKFINLPAILIIHSLIFPTWRNHP